MWKSDNVSAFTVHAGEEEESIENSPAHGSTLHKIVVVRASCPTTGGGMVPVRRHCGGREALSSPDDAIVLCRMEGRCHVTEAPLLAARVVLRWRGALC